MQCTFLSISNRVKFSQGGKMSTAEARVLEEIDGAMLVETLLASRTPIQTADSATTLIFDKDAPLYQIEKRGKYCYLQGREALQIELETIQDELARRMPPDTLLDLLNGKIEVIRVPVGFYSQRVEGFIPENNVIAQENLCFIFGNRTYERTGRGMILIRI